MIITITILWLLAMAVPVLIGVAVWKEWRAKIERKA